jgi:biotin-(acetyl-CoA carboxylase) ligase
VLAATTESLTASQVLRTYLDQLERRRHHLDSPVGLATLRENFVEDLSTLGRTVRVELVDEHVTGRALGVDETGALQVQVGSEVRVFAAGDVVHVRKEEEQ